MTLYPLGIFYLVLPLTWALPVFCIGHLFLGGVGMFVLGRRWCGDATAAAVAGAAYAFNGLTLNSLMWPNNIAALGWLPWVMWALEAAVQERGKKILIAALIGATQMLAGAPEIIIFTWALAGIFALLPVISRRDWRGLPTAFLTLGIVVALTAALAAAQLLPFLNLLQESHRSAGVVGYESPMPPWGWANFLVPLFHTYKSHSGVYFQAGQVWTSSYYISVVAIYLGLFGAFSRRPRTWLLLGGAAFCLIMALGNSGYLYSWLRERFPQVAIMNFPIKFVVPIIFAVPALAAYGMSRFREDMVKRDAVLVASGILAGIAALAWWSYAHPMEPGEWPTAGVNALVRGVFLIGSAFLLLHARTVAAERRFWLSVVLVGLILTDVATHVPWQNPTVTPAAYEPGLQQVRKLNPIPSHGASRAMLTGKALNEFRFSMQTDAFRTYVGHRLGLYDNCNLLENLPKTDGFYSLYLPYESRMRGILNTRTNEPTGLLNFMGVSHSSDPKSIINFVRREGFLPMVLIGAKPMFLDETNALRSVFNPAFDPRATVFFPANISNQVPARSAVSASILESQIEAETVRVRYASPEDTILTIAQTWHPNWTVFIDRKNAGPVLKANHAFQAVAVPAGEHTVELRYLDRHFQTGAWVSGTALALCLTGLAWRRKLPRNDMARAGDGERAQG